METTWQILGEHIFGAVLVILNCIQIGLTMALLKRPITKN